MRTWHPEPLCFLHLRHACLEHLLACHQVFGSQKTEGVSECMENDPGAMVLGWGSALSSVSCCLPSSLCPQDFISQGDGNGHGEPQRKARCTLTEG